MLFMHDFPICLHPFVPQQKPPYTQWLYPISSTKIQYLKLDSRTRIQNFLQSIQKLGICGTLPEYTN